MGTTCSLEPAIHRYEKMVIASVMKYSIRGHLHGKKNIRQHGVVERRSMKINTPDEAVIIIEDSQRPVQ